MFRARAGAAGAGSRRAGRGGAAGGEAVHDQAGDVVHHRQRRVELDDRCARVRQEADVSGRGSRWQGLGALRSVTVRRRSSGFRELTAIDGATSNLSWNYKPPKLSELTAGYTDIVFSAKEGDLHWILKPA